MGYRCECREGEGHEVDVVVVEVERGQRRQLPHVQRKRCLQHGESFGPSSERASFQGERERVREIEKRETEKERERERVITEREGNLLTDHPPRENTVPRSFKNAPPPRPP